MEYRLLEFGVGWFRVLDSRFRYLNRQVLEFGMANLEF